MMKVYACVVWDQPTQTCTTNAWVDMPGLLPTLTIEDGSAIGWKLVFMFVAIRVVRMLGEAVKDRI